MYTDPQINVGFVHIYLRNPTGKTSYFCAT